MPVHVIGAERDLMIPIWKSEELAEGIPGAKLTVLEGQGHGVMWEDGEGFNKVGYTVLGGVNPLRGHTVGA